jgi:diaminopropionate ammonia-lyase
MAAADREGWLLLSDSSWPGYLERPRDVMEGYTIMAAEVAEQTPASPSHIFLQAGVGGLAAACTVVARHFWGHGPKIIVVEPEFAPALLASIEAGRCVVAPGPVSVMGRLDCKEPSLLALDALAREADAFMTVSEADAHEAGRIAGLYQLQSTPSGAAGLAGLIVALRSSEGAREQLQLDEHSRVLLYLSEGPADD